MVDDEKASAAPSGGSIELPLDAWVKGGSTTSAHDLAEQKIKADAASRRQQQDAMYGLSQKRPAEARMSSMKLGGLSSHPSIVLWIKNPKEMDPKDFMLCELSSQPGDSPGAVELVLMMQCPRCVMKRGRRADDAIFHVRSTNRKFWFEERAPKWLEQRWQGRLWINPENPGETCMVAGTINMTEQAHCPGCDWVFVIDDSVVRTIR